MATTAVHQVTLSMRTAVIATIAFVAAIALAVSLPLALRTTHTVIVKTGTPSTSTSQDRQRHPEDAVLELVVQAGRRLAREARLSRATGSGQRQQTIAATKTP